MSELTEYMRILRGVLFGRLFAFGMDTTKNQYKTLDDFHPSRQARSTSTKLKHLGLLNLKFVLLRGCGNAEAM